MTVVYSDYYHAYDTHQFDIANVNFLAMLVDGSYVPNPSHKLDDVCGMIVAVPYVITADDMVTLGMSQLMEKAEADIKAEIEMYPERISEHYKQDLPTDTDKIFAQGRYVVMFNPELEILCYCETINDHLNGK
jgi:hypothetical protein